MLPSIRHLTLAILGWSLWMAPVTAQVEFDSQGFPSLPGSFGIPSANRSKVTFSGNYQLEKGSDQGRLTVVAEIIPKHHIYSTTQPGGGPKPTKITIASDGVELTGPFSADHQPTKTKSPYFEVESEEFHDRVTWTAPIRLKKPDSEPKPIDVKISGQVCLADGNCQPIEKEISVEFKDYYGGAQKVTQLRHPGTHAVWSATIEPAIVPPGGTATIKLSAETDPGYHIYKFQPGDPEPTNRTLIVASQKGGLLLGEPRTDQQIISKDLGLDKPFEYYPGSVSWTIPVEVPASAELGQRAVELLVSFNTCDDRSCDPPAGVKLMGSVTVQSESGDQSKQSMLIEPLNWLDVANHPAVATWIDTTRSQLTLLDRLSGNPLDLWMIGAALLGGFILNFMPCVLPVIGLKLMGFVNQAGSSHRRVVALNLSFVAGILTIIMALALLNIGAKIAGHSFGWGEQFTNIYFQVGLTVLLFAMSLSFLGVWEIPIPGFATGSKSGELMQKEGLSGAFYKGMLTTILATPCSGPFLGTLFGLTLSLSVWSILILFLLVGIGLGLPYLALCLWPGFIKLLPKPGAWMETLKEVLAFPLLLSVVYFLSVIDPDYRIATLSLLIAVWFGCWLIGRVPAYAESRRLYASWLTAAVVCSIAGYVSFTQFGPIKHHLPWKQYSETALQENRAAGKVVMLEFTARWCLTCQYNMRSAIDRPEVAKVVKENGVVPLLADWSNPSVEIENKLRELDSNSIPLLAIYPADPEAQPILLRDVITQSQLIDALEKAGSSQNAAKLTAKAQID